jgi:glucose-1-phosphate thymidylyltransferase
MVKDGISIGIVEATGIWLDIVYPWDLLTMNDVILSQLAPGCGGTVENGVSLKGSVTIGKKTVIRPNSSIVGPVSIGEGCEIGPNVCIFPSTSIGSNVVISPFTEVRNSIVGNDVCCGTGSLLHDSIIDNGCIIGSHFCGDSGVSEIKIGIEHHVVTAGAIFGAGCKLGSNVTAAPGTIVGNFSQIKSTKLISGVLPDNTLVL